MARIDTRARPIRIRFGLVGFIKLLNTKAHADFRGFPTVLVFKTANFLINRFTPGLFRTVRTSDVIRAQMSQYIIKTYNYNIIKYK